VAAALLRSDAKYDVWFNSPLNPYRCVFLRSAFFDVSGAAAFQTAAPLHLADQIRLIKSGKSG
jgi:hypothetical protein